MLRIQRWRWVHFEILSLNLKNFHKKVPYSKKLPFLEFQAILKLKKMAKNEENWYANYEELKAHVLETGHFPNKHDKRLNWYLCCTPHKYHYVV